MPKQPTKQKISKNPVQPPIEKHISSNHLPAFIVQAMIVATLAISATAIVYSIFYGPAKKLTVTSTSKESVRPITEEEVANKPVDESMFSNSADNIDPAKLQNLFPEIK